MATKKISSVEFIRHFGRYHDEAMKEPITLTKHGRASVVVVSADEYERLTQRGSDPRRVYGEGETPPELAAQIEAALDQIIAEGTEPNG